jgi:hypothetical protein
VSIRSACAATSWSRSSTRTAACTTRPRRENIFLTAGINELWKLVTGQSANTFTNAQAQIGIGDSSTAATAGQTDLQAATNKTYKAMNGSFPSVPAAGAVQFQATFASPTRTTPGRSSSSSRAPAAICLDRGVASLGTKVAGTSWTVTVTLTIA